MKLIFDIETNGLLQEATKVHVLSMVDADTKEVFTFLEPEMSQGLLKLSQADTLIGHNVIKFDLPVLSHLYDFKTDAKIVDTLVCTRLLWSTVADKDWRRGDAFPKKLVGSHSLEAWGHRLGEFKGAYDGGWETCTPEMVAYCEQDLQVTTKLYERIVAENYSEKALDLEHRVAHLMAQQERNGFPFKVKEAGELYAKLAQRRMEIEQQLKDTFGSWEVRLPDFIPKRGNKKMGYEAGVPVPRYKTVEFNPASRDHIANRLTTLYGWKPEDYTDGGKPKVDETVLSSLPYPTAPLLAEYFLVNKRIGQLAEGDQAWLKVVRNGRIHGSVNPNGAVTGRATHSYPNVAQVPSGSSEYGPECRDLFTAPPGWTLVGTDAAGLELRCLAHFMYPYDNGAYAKVLLEGDIHTLNQEAAGLPTRNNAKTFIYAYLYGAGDEKIGSIVGKGREDGKKLKARFLKATPALKLLRDAVTVAAKRGFLRGLDGRRVHIRHEHAALNTLLQSAGALVCKEWIVRIHERLQDLGYRHGWDGDYAFCAWVHDEVQIAVKPALAEQLPDISQLAMSDAEKTFGFRCRLDTDSKSGTTWKETH